MLSYFALDFLSFQLGRAPQLSLSEAGKEQLDTISFLFYPSSVESRSTSRHAGKDTRALQNVWETIEPQVFSPVRSIQGRNGKSSTLV